MHILGGTEVQPGEFPFMAALEYKNKDDKKVKYVCSGSLISKQHVLTAAHCYHGTDGRRPTQVVTKTTIKIALLKINKEIYL